MGINTKTVMILMAFAVGMTGCAGLTKRREQDKIGKIKKVAVVAFTANLPAKSNLTLDLGSGNAGAEKGGSMIPDSTSATDQMYFSFGRAVQKNLKWAVMDPQAMRQHPAYQAAYKDTMEGWQQKVPPASGTTDYVVKSVMDWNGPRILKFEGREKLTAALGVDAIIMVRLDSQLKGFTVAGIGPRRPQAQAHVEVFLKGHEAPVWFETFEGEEAKESVGMGVFADENKIREFTLTSAETAYEKMSITQ